MNSRLSPLLASPLLVHPFSSRSTGQAAWIKKANSTETIVFPVKYHLEAVTCEVLWSNLELSTTARDELWACRVDFKACRLVMFGTLPDTGDQSVWRLSTQCAKRTYRAAGLPTEDHGG